jgi:flagellar biosynthesis protein
MKKDLGAKTPKLAVALKYQKDSGLAPTVIAKGSGYIADKIISVAEENNVPVQTDSGLAKMLNQLEINQDIPEELYEPVAQILAFLYRVDHRVSQSKGH